MRERNDLTRWNRAGLTRFRYVDGKAAEYLEILRQQLVTQFADPETGLCEWLKPAEKVPAKEQRAETETLIHRQERLSRKQQRILQMYHQDRRDWAWEITRTFARACHILTEHTNAYANEGYLGTATQWDNVRRLVEMLDYHPAPPASASTRLVLMAKEDKSGNVAKGFQVKYTPATGGDKIIFETLEDLLIDPALNELRPKGWDQSEDPVLPQDGTKPPTGESQFSPIANGPAINIQGVGQISASKLDTSASVGTAGFKIKDFLDLDPDNCGLDIGATWLREWKAKADILVNFSPEGNWSAVMEWLLPDIAAASAESLAELSGNSLEMAESLKRDIAKIEMCLDQSVYMQTRLMDLFAPAAAEAGTVVTSWHAKRKPKIVPDDIVMIYREYEDESTGLRIDEAEAATVASVEEPTKVIHLTPSPVQKTWFDWKKSEARLKVAPRWKRKCWLNGHDVIRTAEPHGLKEGAFVSWKKKNQWIFAKVIKADKRDLRLELTGSLPDIKTPIYEAFPLEGPKVPATMEEFGAVADEQLVELVDYALNVVTEASNLFSLNEPKPDVTTPPLMPPGKLDFGSFLFPSPMLPVDLVKAAVKLLLSMGIMEIPSTGKKVFKFLSDPASAATQIVNKINEAIEQVGGVWLVDSPFDTILELISPPGTETVLFKEIPTELADQLERLKSPLLGIPKDPTIKAVVEVSVPPYMFDGTPGNLETGDWVIGEFIDRLMALKISGINEYTESDKSETFSVNFENSVDTDGVLQKLYADFRGELIAEGATTNNAPVDPKEIELDDVPDSLKVGRDVLLTGEGKKPVAAKIKSINGNTVEITPTPIDFTKGDLIIRGNVVLAGHGEGKPEKILGSGNAAKCNQEFTLEVERVSFTPDATKSSGVAAAIEVKVDGRVWEQVSTLKDSGPGDHHYAIRMTEEGYVKILFGDGEHGRRLPSGKNNIRVLYRVGSGLAGHVPAGGLEKPVSPHPFVKAVLQPLPAAGGGDMEDMASLRENAPYTLLALERAVSLGDFSHLAAAQSSIWQAKAYSQVLHGGQAESVKVVIVPADGVTSLEINEATRTFLQKHTMPGVQVTVEDFNPVLFNLTVTVRVKTDEFIAEEVEKAVYSALVDHFALKNRKLGEPLYLSEVYKVVEGVRGVENSKCRISKKLSASDVFKGKKALQVAKAGDLQIIEPADESTVVYLDTKAGSTFTVTVEEYQP